MYLLDTNVVSELRRIRPHGAVVAWLQSTSERDLHLSAVSIGEMHAGVEMTRDQDTSKADELERWVDQVCAAHQVIPMDVATFRLWARFMKGKSNTLYEDAMIAATAVINRLVVVTRNVRDFAHFDVETLNPFESNRS